MAQAQAGNTAGQGGMNCMNRGQEQEGRVCLGTAAGGGGGGE